VAAQKAQELELKRFTYTRLLPIRQRTSIMINACLSVLMFGALLSVKGQQEGPAKFQREVQNPLNCSSNYRARRGDRVILKYEGLLATGTSFDKGELEFTLGSGKVIRGLEMGMLDGCAGEDIVLIIPPEYGYGDVQADKIPAGSTLYFLTTLNAIVRKDEPTKNYNCNAAQKARPDINVDMKISGVVIQPDGRGNKFFDDPSFEYRFGTRSALIYRGIEAGMTGGCPDETRILLLGPALAYGQKGSKNGKVRSNESVMFKITITKVFDKEPPNKTDLTLSFLQSISSGNLNRGG